MGEEYRQYFEPIQRSQRRAQQGSSWFRGAWLTVGAAVLAACGGGGQGSGARAPAPPEGASAAHGASRGASETAVAVEIDDGGNLGDAIREGSPPEAGSSAGQGGPERAPTPNPTEDELRIAAIEDAVNSTRDARHLCWAYAASDDFRLSGAVRLRMTFAQGNTAAVEVAGDTTGDARLLSCLSELYGTYVWPPVFAPGVAIELPFSFTAPRAQYTVLASHVEPIAQDGGKLSVWGLLDQRNTGNGAASMSVLRLVDGGEIALHRHHAAELFYVRSGAGRVLGLDGKTKGTRIGPGHAIFIAAGTAHGFVHEGTEPLVLVQLFVPGGPESAWKSGGGRRMAGTIPVPASELARPPRQFPRPIVATKPALHRIAGGAAEVAIYFDQAQGQAQGQEMPGAASASLMVLTARKGAQVPLHRHEDASEYVLVLEGSGAATVDGETYLLSPNTAVQIPSNIEHGFEVTSDEPLRAVQVYTPAGPEQRYKTKASK